MNDHLGPVRRMSWLIAITLAFVLCASNGAPATPAPHPQHAAGGNSSLSSGSSTRFIVVPGSPGCLPGRRFPRSRSDRSAPFLYGLSDDGGRDDVDESLRA